MPSRGGARGFGGVPRCLAALWRAGGEEVGLEGLREGAVGLWECGLLRAMPSRSEGRRTFVGLTVHGRMEGGPESHLQSSPAEGLTVTEAEAGHRGEVRGRWERAEAGGGEASARWACSWRGCVMRVCAFLLERISVFFASIMLLFRLYYYPT